MPVVKRWVGADGTAGYSFECPGCKDRHSLRTEGNPIWGFNGNLDKPTFTPSVLITSGHYVTGQEGKTCWCTFEARLGKPAPFRCYRCHSFVTDGRIQFLGDCTHALAGQTVDIPQLETRS